MKWYKHDSDASMDAKIQEILLDYGLEGYGLYWYCLELITSKVDNDNVTFSLEHDCRMIARNTGSTAKRVQEIMTSFIDLGLFESSDGVITCLKLAKRLDKSMTSNPGMRDLIGSIRENHDSVMTKSDKVMQEENRIEEIRRDKKRIDKKKEWVIPEGLNINAWNEFDQHRKAHKSKWSDLAKTKSANILLNLSHEEQQETIDKSIQSGWPGLYPEKKVLTSNKREKEANDWANDGDNDYLGGETYEQH